MRRAWVRIMTIVTLTCYSLPASASQKKSCLDFFSEMASSMDREILSVSEIWRIQDILRNRRFSSERAVNEAFDIYMNARLRILPEDVRNTIVTLLNNKTIINNGPKARISQTEYNVIKQEFLISGPRKYTESAIGLLMRAHELEHAIIDQTHLIRFGSNTLPSKLGKIRADATFLHELAAIRAEWNMVRAVPHEIRIALIRDLEADRTLGPEREILIRFLKNASLDRDDYVAAEHAAGRHTKSTFRMEDAMLNTTLYFGYTVMGMAGIAGGAIVLMAYCEAKSSDRSFDPRTPWYQELCGTSERGTGSFLQ